MFSLLDYFRKEFGFTAEETAKTQAEKDITLLLEIAKKNIRLEPSVTMRNVVRLNFTDPNAPKDFPDENKAVMNDSENKKLQLYLAENFKANFGFSISIKDIELTYYKMPNSDGIRISSISLWVPKNIYDNYIKELKKFLKSSKSVAAEVVSEELYHDPKEHLEAKIMSFKL